MLKNINPTQTKAWVKLQKHFEENKNQRIIDLFQKEPDRLKRLSIQWNDLYADFSKNRFSLTCFQLFIELAEEMDLKDGFEKMFSGEAINATENRPVLHIALRNRSSEAMMVDGQDVMPDVRQVLKKIKDFTEGIHKGKRLGYSQKKITQIVNIGIGGSDLGPLMATEALRNYRIPGMEVHFVSNVDASHIAEVLQKVNADECLFIIASKTFTTQETMTNAHTAREWFLNQCGGNEDHIKKHFIALSTNKDKVIEFGIDPENMFLFWDWVGGRYSLWSAIGFSIACFIGFERFEQLLEGAFEMDQHVKNSPLEKNIPFLMAVIGIWYNNFYKAQSHAILPYDQYLHRFAAYFQQGDMESNGKNIDRNGNLVDYQTGPIIWGEPGTNGQHAFYQLIHQGTKMIPCDFLAPAQPQHPLGDHHLKLMANFFAQTEALMNGKGKEAVYEEMKKAGSSEEEIQRLLPFRTFEGNRPTSSFLYKKLDPKTMGKLIAMYEHKIFIQGYLWNIFSFDQFGVELGKELAKAILPELSDDKNVSQHDPSTNALINQFKKMR